MRVVLPIIISFSLLAVGCFGGGDDDSPARDEPTASPTETVTAAASVASSPAPTATTSVTPSATPTATSSATSTPALDDPTVVCVNDSSTSAKIAGLRVGEPAYADDLANVRGDHSIDATRVGQVLGAGSMVRVVEGPWCNAEFTWWRVEADGVVLADDTGAVEGGETGSVTGWIAEIDQHGVVNLGPDASSVGLPAP